MAKKQRRFEQLSSAAIDPKAKKRYRDPLQDQVGRKLEEVGKRFEGKGRTALYVVGAILVLAIILGIVYSWNKRSSGAAQYALGKAIETSRVRVTDVPPAAGSTEKTFKSEKERAEAAIAEFEAVSNKYGGAVGEKAKYFVAVNRLMTDRDAAITELTAISAGTTPSAYMAKFALAQTKASDGKYDEAASLYQELAAAADPIVSKETVNFELAKVYEKQDKKQEAVDLYLSIAKAAAEAKDVDGKAIPMSQTATEAKEKVTELDPEKAKEIPESAPESPFGS